MSLSLAGMHYEQSRGQGRAISLWLSFLSIASVQFSSRFGRQGTRLGALEGDDAGTASQSIL